MKFKLPSQTHKSPLGHPIMMLGLDIASSSRIKQKHSLEVAKLLQSHWEYWSPLLPSRKKTRLNRVIKWVAKITLELTKGRKGIGKPCREEVLAFLGRDITN